MLPTTLRRWKDYTMKGAIMADKKTVLALKPGKFYRARDGHIWCCFNVNRTQPAHAQAWCVRVDSAHREHRVEYFFLDGRYDEAGKREHTLIEVVEPPE